MKDLKFYQISLTVITQYIIGKYNTMGKQHNGYIYVVVDKMMHGITQNHIIAQNYPKQYLLPYGYVPVPITPELCKYQLWHNLCDIR